jgi:predicted RNA-binding Zn-ribbon protein involved in translation (DUF1610 family)
MPKNKLVVYHGGGYSGCMWEPNAFLFDWTGDFVNLAATGSGGIKDEDTALEKFKEIKKSAGSEIIYNIFSKKDMKELCKDWASIYLKIIIREAIEVYSIAPEKILESQKIAFYCDKCGVAVTDCEDVKFVGLQGFGGIASGTVDMVCFDCFEAGACQKCRENGNEEAYAPEEVSKNGGYCDFHKGSEVLDLLDNLSIKNVEAGAEIIELHKLIALGDWQLQEMYRLGKGGRNNLKWHDNKEKIKAEIIGIWNGLDEHQKKGLIMV